jgi:hypothetical protein
MKSKKDAKRMQKGCRKGCKKDAEKDASPFKQRPLKIISRTVWKSL